MSHDASQLLRAEFATHLPEMPKVSALLASHVGRPSPDLVASLEQSAQAAGVTPNSVDWATVIPAIVAAISTKNPLALIPILLPLAPPAWAFIQQLFQNFHKQPSVTPAGPTISGS